MPEEVVKGRVLQATLWDCDRFQENLFLGCVTIPLESVDLNRPSEKWYKLTNLHRIGRPRH